MTDTSRSENEAASGYPRNAVPHHYHSHRRGRDSCPPRCEQAWTRPPASCRPFFPRYCAGTLVLFLCAQPREPLSLILQLKIQGLPSLPNSLDFP